MAKETRTINGTIRLGGRKNFGPDADPDEVAAALSADQVARLTEKGVISGFSAKADKAAAAAETEEAAATAPTKGGSKAKEK